MGYFSISLFVFVFWVCEERKEGHIIWSTQLKNTGTAALFPLPGEWEWSTGEWELRTGEWEFVIFLWISFISLNFEFLSSFGLIFVIFSWKPFSKLEKPGGARGRLFGTIWEGTKIQGTIWEVSHIIKKQKQKNRPTWKNPLPVFGTPRVKEPRKWPVDRVTYGTQETGHLQQGV